VKEEDGMNDSARFDVRERKGREGGCVAASGE
jgi:hypothetical protein